MSVTPLRVDSREALEGLRLRLDVEEVLGRVDAGLPFQTCETSTRRSGSGNGSGRSSTAFTMLKMALVAPIPSASVSTATSVKPGRLPQAPQRVAHVLAQ